MPEQLTGLNPRGVDFTSAGRSTVKGVDAAHLSACLADCTPLQANILLSVANGVQLDQKCLETLHLRVCRIMLREKWTISSKDSKRKILLMLAIIGFYSYVSSKQPKVREIYEFLGVSESTWHKKWSRKYAVVRDDFLNYLSEQERDGNRAFYRLYMEEV